MTRVMLAMCVFGLMLPGVARAQFLWVENFEDNLDHWTVTTGNGTATLEDGRLKLEAVDDTAIGVTADYPVPWPAEGETYALLISGGRSPGSNGYGWEGAEPTRFIYFDIGSATYFRAIGPDGYFGGGGGPTHENDTSTGVAQEDEAIDFRWVYTGLPGDQVEVQWQWKMTAGNGPSGEEYVTIADGTMTLAKAEYPDRGVTVGSRWRGANDSSIWYGLGGLRPHPGGHVRSG